MTFIIAEVGSNHLSLQDCHDSIKSAKECGADCVKFQMYTHRELYGYDAIIEPPAIYEKSVHNEIYRVKKDGHIGFESPPGPEKLKLPGELPREWIPQLAEACKHYGIEFMCTAFSPDGYRYIDPYVKRHKIASAENTDVDILRTVAELGKPVLMSTGGSSLTDIKMALDLLWDPGRSGVTLMYCVSSYPAKNVNLFSIDRLKHEFVNSGDYYSSIDLGYSCHTDEWYTPFCAIKHHDAIVIEKHFKVRPMYTPDSDHSILPDDFKKMVDAIRCGSGLEPQFPDPQEDDMVKYHKRRFIPELNGYYRTKKPE